MKLQGSGNNYQAWEVDVKDFPEKGTTQEQLFFLLRYAVLAPRSHNSQPWKFKIEGNTIFIFADEKRSVPVADPDGRLERVAVGAALENVLIAADYFGFTTEVQYFPRGWGKDRPVAVVILKKREVIRRPTEHLLLAIPKRYSNRHPYRNDPLPDAFLKQVTLVANYGVAGNVMTEPNKKSELADIILEAREAEFDIKPFREEIAHWKRNNWTRSEVGMPGFTMGFSTLLSFITSPVIRRKNVAKLTRKKDEEVLKQCTPAMIVVSSKEDSRELQIKSGQTFERLALLATQHQLDTNIMVAAIATLVSPLCC